MEHRYYRDDAEWMRFARSGFDGAFANAPYPEGFSSEFLLIRWWVANRN